MVGLADLRIHSIEAIAVDIPLKRNFGGSTYAVLKRSTVITRMRTGGGLVSEVYNGDNREHGLEIHGQALPRRLTDGRRRPARFAPSVAVPSLMNLGGRC